MALPKLVEISKEVRDKCEHHGYRPDEETINALLLAAFEHMEKWSNCKRLADPAD